MLCAPVASARPTTLPAKAGVTARSERRVAERRGPLAFRIASLNGHDGVVPTAFLLPRGLSRVTSSTAGGDSLTPVVSALVLGDSPDGSSPSIDYWIAREVFRSRSVKCRSRSTRPPT